MASSERRGRAQPSIDVAARVARALGKKPSALVVGTLYSTTGSVIHSSGLNYRTRESEMTTSMSIQRAVLTHQKDMVFHANAIFRGTNTHNPR
jgi:hypothetical protein